MKDTVAIADAVRAKYREDLSRKEQEKAKKKKGVPLHPKTSEDWERSAAKYAEPEPEVVEEKPPPVAKKIFDKIDEKRKKKGKKKSAKRSTT